MKDSITVTRPLTGAAGPTMHGGGLGWREDHCQGLHGCHLLLGHVVVVGVGPLHVDSEQVGVGGGWEG